MLIYRQGQGKFERSELNAKQPRMEKTVPNKIRLPKNYKMK